MTEIKIRLLRPEARVPERMSQGGAGYDLFASEDSVVPAATSLSVNSNVEAGAGWIDSDYRGEVMVELKNFSSADFEIKQGDRIAQLMLLPVTLTEFIVDEGLGDTGRGQSGFGSTNV